MKGGFDDDDDGLHLSQNSYVYNYQSPPHLYMYG